MEMSFYQRRVELLHNDLLQIQNENLGTKVSAVRALYLINACLVEVNTRYRVKPFVRYKSSYYFYERIKPRILGELCFYIELLELIELTSDSPDTNWERSVWINKLKRIKQYGKSLGVWEDEVVLQDRTHFVSLLIERTNIEYLPALPFLSGNPDFYIGPIEKNVVPCFYWAKIYANEKMKVFLQQKLAESKALKVANTIAQ